MSTEKSPEFESLITRLFRISSQDAESIKICSHCKSPIIELRDTKSIIGYNISGMCQDCQDNTFGE